MTDDATTTPPPGGQPQALTADERQWGAESDAYLRALLDAHTPSKQHGDEKFTGRCMHCSYTIEPCDTASAAAAALVRSDALDEARAEITRLQDDGSAYDVGYQRADAVAGAVIEWLRQGRDEARARLAAVEDERDAETQRAVFSDQMAASTIADVQEEALRYVQRLEASEARVAHFERLATDQQRLNAAMVASLKRGLAALRASEAECARLRDDCAALLKILDATYDGPLGRFTRDRIDAALAATDRGRAPAGEVQREAADDE